MRRYRILRCGSALLLLGAVAVVVNPVPMPMTALVLGLLALTAGLWGWCYEQSGGRGRLGLKVLAVLAALGVMGLGVSMGMIRSAGRTDWDRARQAEYGIVLGAGVRTDGQPSRIMRSRLRGAMEFLEENPAAMLILSGAQGPGEPVSEAACMYETLVDWGADKDRLLLETESGTTRENLENSLAIIRSRGGTDRPVAVISSEFHTARAVYIAGRLGLDVCPVAARTDQWYFRLNYTLREVFAFVKEALVGAHGVH